MISQRSLGQSRQYASSSVPRSLYRPCGRISRASSAGMFAGKGRDSDETGSYRKKLEKWEDDLNAAYTKFIAKRVYLFLGAGGSAAVYWSSLVVPKPLFMIGIKLAWKEAPFDVSTPQLGATVAAAVVAVTVWQFAQALADRAAVYYDGLSDF